MIPAVTAKVHIGKKERIKTWTNKPLKVQLLLSKPL